MGLETLPSIPGSSSHERKHNGLQYGYRSERHHGAMSAEVSGRAYLYPHPRLSAVDPGDEEGRGRKRLAGERTC